MAKGLSYKMLITTTFLALSFSAALPINRAKTDSLKEALNTTQKDSLKLAILSHLTKAYLHIDLDSTLFFTDAQFKMAQQLAVDKSKFAKRQMAYALNTKGVVFYIKGDYPKSLQYFFESLKIKQQLGDKKGVANTYNNLGEIYRIQGDYAKALENYHKDLEIIELLGDKKGIAMSYTNIGNIHYLREEYTKALEYYYKDLRIKEEIGEKNTREIINTYSNIILLIFLFKRHYW